MLTKNYCCNSLKCSQKVANKPSVYNQCKCENFCPDQRSFAVGGIVSKPPEIGFNFTSEEVLKPISDTMNEFINRRTKTIENDLSATNRQNMKPKGTGKPIFEMVIDDITSRAKMGVEKYGEPLKSFNGRDALLDLYQELLDASHYIRQLMEEKKEINKLCNSAIEYDFVQCFKNLSVLVHENAVNKGFWNTEVDFSRFISLCHAELSEALEAERNSIEHSEHIPDFTGIEEELADVIIRIMDYSGAKKLRVAAAIIAKIQYNKSRPVMHGGKKF